MNGLFKYFPVDWPKVEMLARRQILLTPPKYFNDPWDFLVQRDPITEDEARAMFDGFQRERPSDLSFEEFLASITRPEYVAQEGPDMQDALSKFIGVVSLTSDPYNRLMWGYYTDSHRGFVAEFAHRPATKSHGVDVAHGPFGPAVKVTYASRLPKFTPGFSNPFEVLFTKHEVWDHEDEWRVIGYLAAAAADSRDGKTFYLLRFNPKQLVRVILGLRVDAALDERLSAMLDTEEFAHVRKEKTKIDASSGELSSW
jgi:hypothetical protein